MLREAISCLLDFSILNLKACLNDQNRTYLSWKSKNALRYINIDADYLEHSKRMEQTSMPLRTHVALHPLLHYFNILLNLVTSLVAFFILIFACKSVQSKRAVIWMYVCVFCFLCNIDSHSNRDFSLYLSILLCAVLFRLEKEETVSVSSLCDCGRYDVCWTTLFSILYITVLAIEFSWMVIGSVFYKYVAEVNLTWFHIFALTYLICCWLEIVFLPTTFLCRILFSLHSSQF